METFSHYVGLDVHRRMIAYCVKTADGRIVREGEIEATRAPLQAFGESLGGNCAVGLEATICSHWIYNFLKPYSRQILMAQPAKLKALQAAKNKNDRLDARILADLLRCNLFPECYVLPVELEMLRRQLRYRALLVREQTLFKNKTAGLLIENGVPYQTKKLHQRKYFHQLLKTGEGMTEELRQLLKLNRQQQEGLTALSRDIVKALNAAPELRARLKALQTIKGVGEITSLTWALEVADPGRFRNHDRAISYCGLCKAQHSSAGKEQRGPISKQRNGTLQTVLIEAAHLAPRFNETLRAVREREIQKGAKDNEATIAVARKLVRYLLAIDRQFFAQKAAASQTVEVPLVTKLDPAA